jgi:DNA-binding NtrC family response regulator
LLEDELFGHDRGAFTDAHTQRAGLIAAAEKGTIFIDEVDSLSAKGQVALLRVLQDHRFRPVGSSVERHADVRVLAASNGDLEQRVRDQRFRADLFYRLAIFPIHLPALRERAEDILPLAVHFVRKHARATVVPQLTPQACETLLARDWPGNVRELENAIIRGCCLSRNGCIEPADLGLDRSAPSPARPATPVQAALDEVPSRGSLRSLKQQMIAAFEKQYLMQLVSDHLGNVSRAARAAGKERRELGRLLKKYRIDPKPFTGRS